MSKRILIISILVASTLIMLPVLADTTTTKNDPERPHTIKTNMGKSQITAAQIVCVGTAVGVRETATAVAHSTYTQAVQSAYAIRAAALQKAYTATNVKDVKTAVNAAWKAFNSTTKTASLTWRTSRDTAWKAFRIAAKACNVPASVTDNGSAASEMPGQ